MWTLLSDEAAARLLERAPRCTCATLEASTKLMHVHERSAKVKVLVLTDLQGIVFSQSRIEAANGSTHEVRGQGQIDTGYALLKEK